VLCLLLALWLLTRHINNKELLLLLIIIIIIIIKVRGFSAWENNWVTTALLLLLIILNIILENNLQNRSCFQELDTVKCHSISYNVLWLVDSLPYFIYSLWKNHQEEDTCKLTNTPVAKNCSYCIGFVVARTSSIKKSIFWDVTPYSSKSQSTFWRNIFPTFYWFLALSTLQPWRLTRYVPPNCQLLFLTAEPQFCGWCSQKPLNLTELSLSFVSIVNIYYGEMATTAYTVEWKSELIFVINKWTTFSERI
jgi:hypothetical protein